MYQVEKRSNEIMFIVCVEYEILNSLGKPLEAIFNIFRKN